MTNLFIYYIFYVLNGTNGVFVLPPCWACDIIDEADLGSCGRIQTNLKMWEQNKNVALPARNEDLQTQIESAGLFQLGMIEQNNYEKNMYVML